MSYVDAWFDKQHDRIHAVERVEGRREFREFPANYVFYYNDPRGKFKTIYGNQVSRFSTRNGKEFQKEVRMHDRGSLWESDFNPVFRCLAENYLGVDAPKLQTAFFDIEVDFDPERGYSSPDDPFNAITAISVYLNWMEQMITLAIPPKSLSMESAKDLVSEFSNTFLFETEAEMLATFLDLIEDADVLSGWNSEGYDIPYTINRTIRILSKDDTRKFCLFGQYPKKRTFERFGSEQNTYDLIGRQHLDYMQLYRKYTYEERHSYALDAIGEHELGERKVQYEGTLDQLYNQDFKKFIDYNRQDTALLDRLDKKLRFIDLSNELAHANTVLLATTMGAVAVTEQAIINEAHEQGLIVPNRKHHGDEDRVRAAGAYVATPKRGLHDWVGSIDLNSLYPSIIRSLNMAPETIVGQLRMSMTEKHISSRMATGATFAGAWEGMFGTLEYKAVMDMDVGTEITIDWETGGEDTLSAADTWRLIFDSNKPWILTANGTILTHEKKGVVPGLLERWYTERQEIQAKMRTCEGEERAFWDKRQLVKKINLNSLYGAILNPGCRFFDKRIGQSTTLTGRTIVKHMSAEANKVITGVYDHTGDAMIYGDTDSCYFSAYPILKDEIAAGKIPWSKENVITLYDQVCDQANATFPDMMLKAFHCPKSRSDVIAAGREIVAETGLFITKKRYAALVYDIEGFRTDGDGKLGKVKAMGLDLKRSDTPVFMQDFLKDLLDMVLQKKPEKELLHAISEFRKLFKDHPGFEKGSPKRANKVGHYRRLEEKQGKANMPGHVRASLNWNTLKRMNGDKYSQEIVDGMKVIVCKLKANPLGYTSVAYPTDELRIPEWFKDLPFDGDAMEETIIDNKLDNLIGVLKYDLESTKQKTTFNNLFEWD